METAVERLSKASASEGLLVSLYVPCGKMGAALGMLDREVVLSGNIRSRVTRLRVQSALRFVENEVRSAACGPNGVAFFGTAEGCETLVASEPILGFVYRCERTFYLDPLRAMLLPKEVSALLVLDRGEATLGWTDGRRIVELRSLESWLMPKHSKGGMSQARYARLTQKSVEEFFTKVGAAANEAFLPMLPRLARVVVGGPSLAKGEFVAGDYLDYRLRDLRVADLPSTGYTGEQGLRELCARVGLMK